MGDPEVDPVSSSRLDDICGIEAEPFITVLSFAALPLLPLSPELVPEVVEAAVSVVAAAIFRILGMKMQMRTPKSLRNTTAERTKRLAEGRLETIIMIGNARMSTSKLPNMAMVIHVPLLRNTCCKDHPSGNT